MDEPAQHSTGGAAAGVFGGRRVGWWPKAPIVRFASGRTGRAKYLAVLTAIGLAMALAAWVWLLAFESWFPDSPSFHRRTSLSLRTPYTYFGFWQWNQPGESHYFGALLLLWLPLQLVWVLYTFRRLCDAALPPLYGWLVFVPCVNVLLSLALLVIPSFLPEAEGSWRLRRRVSVELIPLAQADVFRRDWHHATLRAALLTSAAVLGLVVFGTFVLGQYGFALFLGVPLVLFGLPGALLPRNLAVVSGARVATTLTSFFLVLAGLVAFMIEGVVCIAMASPLLLLMWLGQMAAQRRMRDTVFRYEGLIMGMLVFLMPLAMAAEKAIEPPASRRKLTTRMVVQAPPEKVWPLVLQQPELPPLKAGDWLFHLGMAYPVRTELTGSGPGAVRRCVLSTGPMEEVVDLWEPNRRFGFRVTSQPHPMKELSPFSDLHPPHFDACFHCERGEFVLIPRSDGSTEIVGSTWYRTAIRPAWYWHLWTDAVVKRVHRRVLEQVRDVAQGNPDRRK